MQEIEMKRENNRLLLLTYLNHIKHNRTTKKKNLETLDTSSKNQIEALPSLNPRYNPPQSLAYSTLS